MIIINYIRRFILGLLIYGLFYIFWHSSNLTPLPTVINSLAALGCGFVSCGIFELMEYDKE